MAFDKAIPDDQVPAGLPGLVTLGGCVVGHLAASLNGRVIQHRRHLWRRPTIAMMSEPVSRFRLDFSKMPTPYANYFVNDAGGKHQAELTCVDSERERIFLFDVTRDVFTGVVEIEPDVWVMDPVDAIHMVDGLTHETMSPDILEEICRDSVRRLSPIENWDAFFPVWKRAFQQFADQIDGQYERIMIAEIYPTLTRLDSLGPFYAKNVAEMNDRLDHMYAWVRENFSYEWIGLSRERSVTGLTGVPYNGPTPTHFIGESHGVFALDFIRKLNSGYGDNSPKFDEALPLIEQAFERAKLHEEVLEEISGLKGELEALTQDLAQARNRIEALGLEAEDARAVFAEAEQAHIRQKAVDTELMETTQAALAATREDVVALNCKVSELETLLESPFGAIKYTMSRRWGRARRSV